MLDLMQCIIDFHEKFGIEYNGPVRKLPHDLRQFRLGCSCEEILEYDDAKDIPHEIDALIDGIYFALGTIHLQGITKDKFYEAFLRVHRANMNKVRSSEQLPGKRKSPFDVVKPVGWIAPDIRDLCQ